MSKTHHRERGWGKIPLGVVSGAVDDHTHVMSVVKREKDVSDECISKGLEPIPFLSSDDIVQQTFSAGVEQFIEVGCEMPEWEPTIKLARSYPQRVFAALAIHPNEVALHDHCGAKGADGEEVQYRPWHDTSYEDALTLLEETVRANRKYVVAIGESGLDLYRSGEETLSRQIQAVRDHVQLAREMDLPIQLHVRDAYEHIERILLEDKVDIPVVFHSFAGDEHLAKVANENGWYLSFSGTLTFKGNDRLRKALRIIDRKRILVETDAPYLTPMPYRGRINTPAMSVYTLEAMGEILGMSVQEAATITSHNARELYCLPSM